jgi:hypothetical protein
MGEVPTDDSDYIDGDGATGWSQQDRPKAVFDSGLLVRFALCTSAAREVQ